MGGGKGSGGGDGDDGGGEGDGDGGDGVGGVGGGEGGAGGLGGGDKQRGSSLDCPANRKLRPVAAPDLDPVPSETATLSLRL